MMGGELKSEKGVEKYFLFDWNFMLGSWWKFDLIELQVIINRDTLVKLLAKHTENVSISLFNTPAVISSLHYKLYERH